MSVYFSHFCHQMFRDKLLEGRSRLLIAISGGIDSMVMTSLLAEYRGAASNKNLHLEAAYVKIDEIALSDDSIKRISQFTESLNIPFHILEGRVNPELDFKCYYCARERRKQLCIFGYENKFDAIAFAHNADDSSETGLMNLIFHGHMQGLLTEQSMFKGLITIIRPLVKFSKKWIEDYAKEKSISPINHECPYEKKNRRYTIRNLIKEIEKFNPPFKKNLRTAVNRWTDELK